MSNLEYLAGFFDGEGCVNIQRPDRAGRQSLVVQVSNTQPAVLWLYQDRWNGRIIDRDNGPNRKRLSVWRTYSVDALAALTDMLPHLIIKKGAAEIGIEFQMFKMGDNSLMALKGRHPRRTEILESRLDCYEQLRVLNHRGVA